MISTTFQIDDNLIESIFLNNVNQTSQFQQMYFNISSDLIDMYKPIVHFF